MAATVLNSQGEVRTTEGFEHVLRYDNGIGVDFVLASGSVPVNYDYTKLEVENCNNGHEIKDKKKM